MNLTIKIESNIQIPPKRTYLGKWQSALIRMKSGDSFIVPDSVIRNTVIGSARYHAIKVTTRKINGEGYRIWRVK